MKAKAPRSMTVRSAKPPAAATRQRDVKRAAAAMSLPATSASQSVQLATLAKVPPKSVSGQVVEERSGLALAGVTVKWRMRDASTRDGARPVALGSAVTNGDGRFVIEAGSDAQTQAALCRAQHSEDGDDRRTFLSLVDRNDKILGKPVEVTADAREIALHAPTDEKPSKPQWQALANYLVTNRMMLVQDATQQLSAPFADSPVAGWPVPVRASALRQMLDALTTEDARRR